MERQVELGLALLRYLNSVDPRRMIFKLHKTLKLKLSTSIIGEGAGAKTDGVDRNGAAASPKLTLLAAKFAHIFGW